jgi:CRP-like cAMP-binding protein
MIVDTGRLTRSKLSCSEEEKAAILEGGVEMIREHSIIIDEIIGTGDDQIGGRVTGALHNFEAGKIAYATVISTGPSKVWIIPGDKFRPIVAKPEYSLAVMSLLATEVRSGSKSIRSLLNDLKSGVSSGGVSNEGSEYEIKVLCYDVS